jgi:hypothetical protein
MSRKQKSFRPDRRRFLGQALTATTAATYALGVGKLGRNAYAEGLMQSRQLINIHAPGGWDTFWFYMEHPLSWAPTETERLSFMRSEGGAVRQVLHQHYTQRASSGIQPYANGEHFMGIGGANALAGADFFNQRVCVWKGLVSGGAHGIPNQNILHGNLSAYSISFSGLAADYFAAQHGRRPLHYVQTTQTPTQFGAQWAMAKGNQIPINVPDLASLRSLTSPTSNDLSDAGQYARVSDAIRRLGEEIGKQEFSLRRSQEIYQQFTSFFQGALSILQLGTSLASFESLWNDYSEDARRCLLNLYGAFRDQVSPDVMIPYLGSNYNQRFSFRPGAPDHLGWRAQIEARSGSAWTQLRDIMFRFALADFLITRNLSSVVDVLGGSVDAHDKNDLDLAVTTLNMVGFRRVVQALAAAGKLDSTLVVMFSEFDRSGNLGVDVGFDWRGTEHGASTSLLFAGLGMPGGKVVGATKSTGSSPFAGFSEFGWGYPLPIDPSSGLPSSTGKMLGFDVAFPTIMGILGVPIPANQLTDAQAVAALTRR